MLYTKWATFGTNSAIIPICVILSLQMQEKVHLKR